MGTLQLWQTRPATRALISVLVGILMLGVVGCGQGPDYALYEFTGPAMGTSYSVKLVDPPDTAGNAKLEHDLAELLTKIEAHMSTWLPDSEVSKINHSTSTDWLEVSDDTYEVLSTAMEVSTLTSGAFDVTTGPLVNLWGFGPDQIRQRPPTVLEIKQAHAHTGFKLLTLRATPPAVRKAHRDVYIDLSGIAKGYAVDRIAELLEDRSISNFLVEIGGELRARGHNAHGDRWAIAIEKPASNERSLQRLIRIGDQAVATSGNYRNYFDYNDTRYSHVIDPRTGAPVTHDLASVTVIGASAMFVDALATGFTVLGPAAGFELATRHGIAALFISRSEIGFTERSTPSFDTMLAIP